MVARLDPHLIDHGFVFGCLRGLQRHLGAVLKHGRGVGHRLIQPKAIEGIAKIIMLADVAFGLLAVVTLQPKPELFKLAQQPLAGEAIIDRLIAGMHQIHESLQIRCRPPFI